MAFKWREVLDSKLKVGKSRDLNIIIGKKSREMHGFEGCNFLFVPNSNSSTLKYLGKLLADKGGRIIENVDQLDPETIIVVNDSFVGDEQNIAHEDILRKESDFDVDDLCDYIARHAVKCVRASKVSGWLKTGDFTTAEAELVHLTADAGEKPANEGDLNSNSELDTDIEETKSMQTSVKYEKAKVTPSDSNRKISKLECQKWSKNELVIKYLDILAHRYKVRGDNFRSRGYHLAKIGIQRLPHEIGSGEEAMKEVSNVGISIAKKIQIILETGTLPGAYEISQSEEDLRYLSQCYNVGIYTARRWTNLGLKTFLDVARKFPQELKTDWPIVFGWSFYEDWSIPIPRKECFHIGELVHKELKRVDSHCQMEIQGSYLRGADYCGDLDLLFYKENCNDTIYLSSVMEKVAINLYRKDYIRCFLNLTPRIREIFAHKIIDRLRKCNLPIETPAVIPTNQQVKKFHLGFQVPGSISENDRDNRSSLAPGDQFMSLRTQKGNSCRRVDFFSCKWSELGASRLQWTGPKEFNRWLRLIAMEKGMRLTQHGLFDNDGVLLESFSDHNIFRILDQPYYEPEERNHVLKRRRSK